MEMMTFKNKESINYTSIEKKKRKRDFPGGPVIRTSSSNDGDVGSNRDRVARTSHALCLHAQSLSHVRLFVTP